MGSTDTTFVAGIDLGATNLRVAIANGDHIEHRERRRTPQGPTGEAVTEAILETLDAALEATGVDATDLAGVGVGSIGPLDQEGGVIVDPPNLPRSVTGVRLADPIAEHTGASVRVENDAIAGLIGERSAAEDPPDNMVYLTFSTGIGAGVAVDGRVLHGWGDNVGEVGHLVLDPDSDVRCGCGRAGHWEAFASGSNIPDYARYLAESFKGDTDLPVHDAAFSAADVFAAAGEDVLADMVIHRMSRWNARGVANIVSAFAPELVSIGGTVALENPDLLVDPIRDRLPPLLITRVPEIRTTPLEGDAVLYGALAIARSAEST